MPPELPNLQQALLIFGIAIAIYIVLIACARVLRRSRGWRFGWTYHAFAFCAGLLAGMDYSTWQSTWSIVLVHHLAAATIFLAAFPAVPLINHLLWRQADAKGKVSGAPRVLIDVTAIVVVVATALIVLQFVYDVPVPGLLAGSGVIAIVLGLAMQDLLGNILAGIALHLEKNFKTGDWLLIGDTHARVIEVSWRSTRLLTTDDVLIDVPNSDIAKQTITNFELPTPRHAVRTTIGLHYDIPPGRVQAVLKEAVAVVPGVVTTPSPVIHVKEFADSSIVYEIKVWIDDHGLMQRVLSQVRANAWYAVRRAGMEIPYPQLTIHRGRFGDDGGVARRAAAAALRAHPILGVLGDEASERLVQISPMKLFATSEHIIEQGAAGDSLFLLVHGRAEVRIARQGVVNIVAQIGAGDCVGEMSLLTGDPRGATVVALAEVEALEIQKAGFAELVRAHPEILAKLSELLAQRQTANEKQLAQADFAARVEQTRVSLLRKFRGFFQLGD